MTKEGFHSKFGDGPDTSKWRAGFIHSGAAVTTALVLDTLINPLFVSRIRMQTEFLHHTAEAMMRQHQGGGQSKVDHSKRKYRWPFQTLAVMAREEGLRSWFSGLIPTYLGASQVALQFPVYEAIKSSLVASELKFLSVPEEELEAAVSTELKQRSRFASAEVDTDLEMVTASAIAAADLLDPASAVLPPEAFDGVETKQHSHSDEHHKLTNGNKRLAGTLSTPSTALSNAERYRPEIASGKSSAEEVKTTYRPSHLGQVIASLTSKLVSSAFTYPHEVIRARLQDQRTLKKSAHGAVAATDGAGSSEQRYKGVIDCVKKTYRGEGWKGLYAGFSVNLFRALPAAVVTFYVYENSLHWLKRHVDKDGRWKDRNDERLA
jgi:solute carrier family 25 (mitochondrial folate transporter), member 32